MYVPFYSFCLTLLWLFWWEKDHYYWLDSPAIVCKSTPASLLPAYHRSNRSWAKRWNYPTTLTRTHTGMATTIVTAVGMPVRLAHHTGMTHTLSKSYIVMKTATRGPRCKPMQRGTARQQPSSSQVAKKEYWMERHQTSCRKELWWQLRSIYIKLIGCKTNYLGQGESLAAKHLSWDRIIEVPIREVSFCNQRRILQCSRYYGISLTYILSVFARVLSGKF